MSNRSKFIVGSAVFMAIIWGIAFVCGAQEVQTRPIQGGAIVAVDASNPKGVRQWVRENPKKSIVGAILTGYVLVRGDKIDDDWKSGLESVGLRDDKDSSEIAPRSTPGETGIPERIGGDSLVFNAGDVNAPVNITFKSTSGAE